MVSAPSTRATRSRFASPMQAAATDSSSGSGSGNGGSGGSGASSHPSATGSGPRPGAVSTDGSTSAQKALMARWLEPPVQNRPSFEEDGFQRHGVFDGMASLGSLPKPAMLAKRLQNLPEEKLYHNIAGGDAATAAAAAAAAAPASSKQSAKRKQKEQRERRKQKQQQQVSDVDADDDDDGLDGPEAQQEQWRREEAEAKQAEEAKAEQAKIEQVKAEEAKNGAPSSKKIILKRPSAAAAKKPPTRIVVSSRRATQAAADADEDTDKGSPLKRKMIIVSPKSKAKDDKEPKEQAQSATKGRRRSRRSTAAAVEAEAEEKAEEAEEIKVKRSPSTQKAKSDAESQDKTIQDSDDNDSDSDDDGDDISGLVMNSSILPLAGSSVARPRSDSNATVVNKEVTDHVITIAVAEALRHGRYPTAWAIRTLYDEQSGDQKFLAMVEDVFQQTADCDTLDTFVRLVQEKKKAGKKDGQGLRHFVAVAKANASSDSLSDRPPLPAPYADLLNMDFATLLDPDKAKVWAMDREARRQWAASNDGAGSEFEEDREEREDREDRDMDQEADGPDDDADAHASKKVKLTASDGQSGGQPRATVPPKTPTRGRGRPLGSTKKAKALAIAEAAAAAASAAASATASTASTAATSATAATATATLTDAETAVTPRHQRARASSTSSLSSTMSLSPPGTSPRKKPEATDGDDKAFDGVGKSKTSVGWSINTLREAALEKKRQSAAAEKNKDKNIVKNKNKDHAAKTHKQETPKQPPPADRPKSGPGSGRGGRRRGAGRPPKNRGLAGTGTGTGAGGAHAADAVTPSKAATGGKRAEAPAPTPALQPIATRNKRTAAKKTPTLISASTDAQSHAELEHSSHPSNNSHPAPPASIITTAPATATATATASTPSLIHKSATGRSQPKRSSATAAAAAISSSAAREAEARRELETTASSSEFATMPSAVQEPASARAVPASKRARASASGHKSSPASAGGPKSTSAAAAAASVEQREEMRQKARQNTNSLASVEESYMRRPLEEVAAAAAAAAASQTRGEAATDAATDATSASPAAVATPTNTRQRQLRASTTARTTRSSRKRAFDEVEDTVSPRSASASVQPDEAPATPVAASRAGTPGPKAKKPRVGPRVKTSPVKKKTNTPAGTQRGCERSPTGSGIPFNMDDNDDFCASCGGSGDLLCCDGCTLSFHFVCVDPPLPKDDSELPDEWFCNSCIGRHNPAALARYSGLLAALSNNMEMQNSRAFNLPADIREYFEGVKTGPDGEYEAVVQPAASRVRRRAGYDEAFDFFRLRDFDNNIVLCHGCNRSAENPNKRNEAGRPIIPCAFCQLWWHIDCLDPPLAQPPPIRNWCCPAHVDDLLAQLPLQLGPAHRFRKIKGAPVVKSAYTRGMLNNGFVEIASDDEDTSNNNSGWKTPANFGRIQRVSAESVKLDFMETVRHERGQTWTKGKGQQRRDRLRRAQERIAPPQQPVKSEPLLDRQFIDKAQAAQGLATIGGGVDSTGHLINALLQNAEPSMIALMAQASPVNMEAGGAALQQQDRVALEAMRARIAQLLGDAGPTEEPNEPNEPNEGTEDMSLVTDNGDSDMNEDEELPAIATPSASASVVAAGEPAAQGEGGDGDDVAEWPAATGKEDTMDAGFHHHHHHRHLPPVHVDVPAAGPTNNAAADQASVKQMTLPSPLTPPATSEVAMEDDDDERVPAPAVGTTSADSAN